LPNTHFALIAGLVAALSLGTGGAAAAQSAAVGTHTPTITELLSVQRISGASISPDGRYVAYLRTSADFDTDAFVAHVWLADTQTSRVVQLTRDTSSASDLHWSPDSRWLSFISSRHEKRGQIFAIRPDGGEAVRLSDAATDVKDHAWSPDGHTIAFTVADEDADGKARAKEYGDFQVVRREYRFVHLWTLSVDGALDSATAGAAKGTRVTAGRTWSVESFDWSPDSRRLAFSASKTPDLVDRGSEDIYVIGVNADGGADGVASSLVTLPGPDSSPRWSPDGQSIAFTTSMGDRLFFHANRKIAIVSAAGGTPRSLTDAFDENASPVAWKKDGLYFSGLSKTASHLFRVDPAPASGTASGAAAPKITRVSAPDDLAIDGASLSGDGTRVAFVAASAKSLPEVYVTEVTRFASAPASVRKLTDETKRIAGWKLGVREVISWKSQDGEIIEGVLVKPADYDPARRYPLLCVIHGGPTGIDRPGMVDTRIYPVDLWVARGALVLRVNYRGSAGYGQRFRQLNVNNLGVGDAWDVLSGIDALIAQGRVDPDKLACMGWSQGGYISAFLTTSSTRFKAISVGAGISDWATYYYNTDITPFTRQYLGANPVENPKIYEKTSPISYVKKAATPTLVQHGELDRRVPIANAYELRQALEDGGVPVEMVVYKGFGHGIDKPKAARAVMEHNFAWFNHYIFGDPAPDLTGLRLPAPATDTATATK
jgi:dipeptidyl aminopeptidase/acylaminoacyl peptidase